MAHNGLKNSAEANNSPGKVPGLLDGCSNDSHESHNYRSNCHPTGSPPNVSKSASEGPAWRAPYIDDAIEQRSSVLPHPNVATNNRYYTQPQGTQGSSKADSSGLPPEYVILPSGKNAKSTVKSSVATNTSVQDTNTNTKTKTGGTSIISTKSLLGAGLLVAGLGYAWHTCHLNSAAISLARDLGCTAKTNLTEFADTAKDYASGYGIGPDTWKKPPPTFAEKLSQAADSAWNTGTSLANNAWEKGPRAASNAWAEGSEVASSAWDGVSEMASNANDWYQAGGAGSAYQTSKATVDSVLPTPVKNGGIYLFDKGSEGVSKGVSNVGEWYANGGAGEAYDTARGATATGFSMAGSGLRTVGSMGMSVSDWVHQ